MDACMRKETSSFPHPFLLLSGEKIAKPSLQENSFSLAGSGLPFSRFIQAIFMGDSFFKCPAPNIADVGVFCLWKEKNSHFGEDSGTDAEHMQSAEWDLSTWWELSVDFDLHIILEAVVGRL